MKKRKLVISEQATHDLADIWLYIANDSPQVADKSLDVIYENCQLRMLPKLTVKINLLRFF